MYSTSNDVITYLKYFKNRRIENRIYFRRDSINLIKSLMTFSRRMISPLDRFDPSKNIRDRYLLARANQRPGRWRLIKIARTRFGGIAAAAVGRFSTIRPAVSLSLVPLRPPPLSLCLSSRSFLCIPRLTTLLVVLVLRFYPSLPPRSLPFPHDPDSRGHSAWFTRPAFR